MNLLIRLTHVLFSTTIGGIENSNYIITNTQQLVHVGLNRFSPIFVMRVDCFWYFRKTIVTKVGHVRLVSRLL